MNTPSGPLALGRVGSGPRHQEHHAARTRESEGGPHSNKTINMLTAWGEAHSAGNDSLSAHRLAWVDPESGEPLELELQCADAFRDVLESIGFERVPRMELEPTAKEDTNMNMNDKHSAAAQSYAGAHASHYEERDYPAALRSYDELIALHPSAPEAEYARAQIRNIVKNVIPAKELLAAQLELALHYMRPDVDSPVAVSP